MTGVRHGGIVPAAPSCHWRRRIARGLAVLALVSLLTACPRDDRAATAAAAAAEREAATQLANYEQARRAGSYEVAQVLATLIQQRYPTTSAAAEVARTQADTIARARTMREQHRLAALWIYHALVKDADGRQQSASGDPARTAYLYASADSAMPAMVDDGDEPEPDAESVGFGDAAPARIRLVVRRHPDWGQSVFLQRDDGVFACPDPCRVTVGFDAAPVQPWDAYPSQPEQPPTLFFGKDETFLAALRAARRLHVTLPAEHGRRLTFELAGFDYARFADGPVTPLP